MFVVPGSLGQGEVRARQAGVKGSTRDAESLFVSHTEIPPMMVEHYLQPARPWIVAAAILVAGAMVSTILWFAPPAETNEPSIRALMTGGALMGSFAGREVSYPNPPLDAPEMVDEIQSTLRNAALAMESWATANGGSYGRVDFEDLFEEGLRIGPEVTVTLEATVDDYCIVAAHSMLPAGSAWRVATYDGSVGEILTDDGCR